MDAVCIFSCMDEISVPDHDQFPVPVVEGMRFQVIQGLPENIWIDTLILRFTPHPFISRENIAGWL
jgi:hypothetical protein